MATGIFLCDQLLTAYAAVCLPVCVGAMVCCLLVMLVAYQRGNRLGRGVFGVAAALLFFFLGGTRLLQEHLRATYPWSEEEAVYWGEVLTPPVAKGKTMQAEVEVEQMCADSLPLLGHHTLTIPVKRMVLLYWMPDSLQRPMECGDKVVFSSTVTQPTSTAELTGFDYASYLHRKGISGTAMIYKGDWKVYDRQESLGLKQLALRCRDHIVARYRKWNLGTNEFAVVSALTIGDKSVLTTSLKEMYSAAGVSHVLALSGLHIGILSAILFFLLSPLKRWQKGEWIRSFLVVIALWIFAFVSGLSPSVVRAVTMCSLYFLATCVSEERFSGLYALVLAAFLMLLYQPFYLFDLSCQLSFLAVGAILYFYPLLSGCLTIKNKVVRWLWNGMSVSVAAQLGTLPLILYYFGTFPTYFLLANLIVSILAVCILCGALAALMATPIPYVGPFLIKLLNTLTYTLNTSIQWVQQLSGSQLESLSISLLQAICGFFFLYGLYQFATQKKSRYAIWMLVALNLTLGEWALRPLQPKESALYFSRTQLYLKENDQVRTLTSVNGLYTIDTLTIAVISDTCWSAKQAQKPIPLDYLYLTKGFKGNVKTLTRVFDIRHLVVDNTLSARYRQFIKQECGELKIPCTDSSAKGSFRILL